MIYKLVLLNKFVQVELGSFDNFEEATTRMKNIINNLHDKNYKSYIYIVAVNDTECVDTAAGIKNIIKKHNKNYNSLIYILLNDTDYVDTDIISNIKRMNDDVRKETKKLW